MARRKYNKVGNPNKEAERKKAESERHHVAIREARCEARATSLMVKYGR